MEGEIDRWMDRLTEGRMNVWVGEVGTREKFNGPIDG